jgi:hypothetical protein
MDWHRSRLPRDRNCHLLLALCLLLTCLPAARRSALLALACHVSSCRQECNRHADATAGWAPGPWRPSALPAQQIAPGASASFIGKARPKCLKTEIMRIMCDSVAGGEHGVRLALSGRVTTQPFHVVLLGDSIFDNGAYTRGAPDVVSHLRGLLPAGAQATLRAIDGAITAGLPSQLERVPADASHLVIAIGGNDALQNSDVLTMRVTSSGEALQAMPDELPPSSAITAAQSTTRPPWACRRSSAPSTTARSKSRAPPWRDSRWRFSTMSSCEQRPTWDSTSWNCAASVRPRLIMQIQLNRLTWAASRSRAALRVPQESWTQVRGRRVCGVATEPCVRYLTQPLPSSLLTLAQQPPSVSSPNTDVGFYDDEHLDHAVRRCSAIELHVCAPESRRTDSQPRRSVREHIGRRVNAVRTHIWREGCLSVGALHWLPLSSHRRAECGTTV